MGSNGRKATKANRQRSLARAGRGVVCGVYRNVVIGKGMRYPTLEGWARAIDCSYFPIFSAIRNRTGAASDNADF